MVLMRPVDRPRLTEKGCSNSEGGVRPALCYHQRGGQPHTKSHIGISTAKASVCRANRRVKTLPHHPAHTIEPSVSKGSTGGNVATWRSLEGHIRRTWRRSRVSRHGYPSNGGTEPLPVHDGESAKNPTTIPSKKPVPLCHLMQVHSPKPAQERHTRKAICPMQVRQQLPWGDVARHLSLGTRQRGVSSGSQGLGAYAPTMSIHISLGFCARGGSKA